MIPLQDCKFVSLALKSTATNATATANIDTLGFKYLTVAVDLDTAASTTSNPATLQLLEADATTAAFATVSGFVGDTDFTIANAETTKTTALACVMNMDLNGRKRYIQFQCTPAGAAQVVGAIAILSRGDTPATGGGASASATG